MHVLVAAHDLHPDPGSGGSGRYVYETGRRLADRGHRVSVVTRRRGDVPRWSTVEGMDVHRYDVTVADEAAPTVLRQLPRASQSVRGHVDAIAGREPPDVVSFQGPITSLLVDRAVPDAVPRVTTFHSPWPTEYAIRTRGDDGRWPFRHRLNVDLRRSIEGDLLRRSDGAVTLSEYMREKLHKVYGPVVETTVVPGGVDAQRFCPDAGVHDSLDGGGLTYLTVRRLVERMGHGRLLEAFSTVLEDRPRARLFVAGDGPLRSRLERRASRMGVADRTPFLGFVPEEKLPAAYATADVFVLPTRRLEGFGLATLEALAAGTPVVATPVGGTVEVLAGLADGLPARPLVDSPRADSIAEGMLEWAGLEERARERASDTCRRYAREEYGWDQSATALLEVYDHYAE